MAEVPKDPTRDLYLYLTRDYLQVGKSDRAEPGGSMIAGIAGLIPTEVMDVRLLSLLGR
jgi:hypothetical protein